MNIVILLSDSFGSNKFMFQMNLLVSIGFTMVEKKIITDQPK